MDKRIEVATVVYYDGFEAYTTHRALWVDCTEKMKLTTASKRALMDDMNSAGVEVLKVDFNGNYYASGVEFMREYEYKGHNDDGYETEYVKNKFIEYFCK